MVTVSLPVTITRLQREIEHLKGASARSESPHVVELGPLGPDTDGTTSHQELTDQDSSVVPASVISPPLPSVLGEPPTCSPPRVVQLPSSVTTPITPASSGRIPPVPATCVPGSARKGKAPPFDTFSGEDPEVRIEDWIPSLQ